MGKEILKPTSLTKIESLKQQIKEKNKLINKLNKELNTYKNIINTNNDNLYIKVEWPESQSFMERKWFRKEAILDINESSAYFIPLTRIFKFKK